MIWFVLFIPIAIVLCFVDLRDLPSVKFSIASFALLGVAVVALRKRVGPGPMLAGAVAVSLAALVWMRR
jgi:hypothetical protein